MPWRNGRGPGSSNRLIEAFRVTPDAPLRAGLPVLLVGPVDGLNLIMIVLAALGPASVAGRHLLAGCRAQAVGMPIAELCNEMGFSAATLYRHRRSASAAVAAFLNERQSREAGP